MLRTALTMLAGGAALVHLGEGSGRLTVVAIGLLGLGIVAAIVGYLRYRTAGRAIRSGGLPEAGSGAGPDGRRLFPSAARAC